VLIYQDWIAVRIKDHEARRTSRCLICFRLERYALGFELPLEIANIGEDIKFLRIAVPAGIKGEDVLFEHPLKQAEGRGLHSSGSANFAKHLRRRF
jgi:hypothetical protein